MAQNDHQKTVTPKEKENMSSEKISEQKNEKNDHLKKMIIAEEIAELLNSDNIIEAIKNFKIDSDEKEIVIEFVKSHIQFLSLIVENDYKKGLIRNDVEIQDLISHVNVMLSKKDEYLFSVIAFNSPSHYNIILNNILKKSEKVEENSSE